MLRISLRHRGAKINDSGHFRRFFKPFFYKQNDSFEYLALPSGVIVAEQPHCYINQSIIRHHSILAVSIVRWVFIYYCYYTRITAY